MQANKPVSQCKTDVYCFCSLGRQMLVDMLNSGHKIVECYLSFLAHFQKPSIIFNNFVIISLWRQKIATNAAVDILNLRALFMLLCYKAREGGGEQLWDGELPLFLFRYLTVKINGNY